VPALIEILNRQLIELDRLNGASALATDVNLALDNTIEEFFGDRSRQNILIELFDLYHTFLDCRPRMPHIVSDLQRLIFCLHQNENAGTDELRTLIKDILDDNEKRVQAMMSFIPDFFNTEQSLLVHSLSLPIQRAFEFVAHAGQGTSRNIGSALPGPSSIKIPNVFIADQEPAKSARFIKLFDQLKIPFEVISEFAACHIVPNLKGAIFGGLMLTPKHEVVLAPGSTALISQLKMANIPVYLFLGSNKFSFWEQETSPSFQETRQKKLGSINYQKEVFSHDVVQDTLFTSILTEVGFLSPMALRDLYIKKQQEFFHNERILSSIPVTKVISPKADA